MLLSELDDLQFALPNSYQHQSWSPAETRSSEIRHAIPITPHPFYPTPSKKKQ